MIERLLVRLVQSLSRVLSAKFHSSFNMTMSAEELYEQGIEMVASGFVVPSTKYAFGLYLVRYKDSTEENKYGRYN